MFLSNSVFAQKRKVSGHIVRCQEKPHIPPFFFALLKTKIQLNKFEDLIGFVKRFMKRAASHLVNKRGALRSSAMEEFYRQKLDGSRKLLAGGK